MCFSALFTCLIPRFDGVIISQEWKEALWDNLVAGAPRARTPSEQQYSDRSLRSRYGGAGLAGGAGIKPRRCPEMKTSVVFTP